MDWDTEMVHLHLGSIKHENIHTRITNKKKHVHSRNILLVCKLFLYGFEKLLCHFEETFEYAVAGGANYTHSGCGVRLLLTENSKKAHLSSGDQSLPRGSQS